MTISAPTPTLDDFLSLPEEKPALEFEEGKVTQKVSPMGRHGRLQLALGGAFNAFGEPRRLAMAFSELRTTYTDQKRSYVPDVAVYRWDRIPLDENGEIVDRFVTAPDIAVEIWSPEQTLISQLRRCQWYVANGVTVALAVDPLSRAVYVVRPGVEPVAVQPDERIDLDDVLPGFEMTPRMVFDSLRPG